MQHITSAREGCSCLAFVPLHLQPCLTSHSRLPCGQQSSCIKIWTTQYTSQRQHSAAALLGLHMSLDALQVQCRPINI